MDERTRRAIGHGERAGVDVGRRVEEVNLCELLDPGQVAVAPFVGGRDQPVLECETLRLAPQRRELDGVDAVAPGVPLREPRLVQPVIELQPVERSAHLGAELLDLGLELAQAA
jgi:hypothetical protein